MSSPYRRGQGLSPRQRRLLQASARARNARPQSAADSGNPRQRRTVDGDDELLPQPADAAGGCSPTATPAALRVPLSPIACDVSSPGGVGTPPGGPSPGGPPSQPARAHETRATRDADDTASFGPRVAAGGNSAARHWHGGGVPSVPSTSCQPSSAQHWPSGSPATSPLSGNPMDYSTISDGSFGRSGRGRTGTPRRPGPGAAPSTPSARPDPPRALRGRRGLGKFPSDEIHERTDGARHYRIVYRGAVTLLPSLECLTGDEVGGGEAAVNDSSDNRAIGSRREEVCVGHGEIVSTSSPERVVPVATNEKGGREFVRVVRVDSVVTSAVHRRDDVVPGGGGGCGCLGYLPLSAEGRAVAEPFPPDEGDRLADSVQRGPFRCELPLRNYTHALV